MQSESCNVRNELLRRMHGLQTGNVRLMEVCGTHTMSIARSGLKRLLPEGVQLISGPGCPVCVTPPEVMDAALKLSERDDVIIASYGDMARVPSSVPGDNLLRRRAQGARLEIVYSPMDALELAQKERDSQLVFLGVGFETTAPGTAATILRAAELGIPNFSVFSMLKRVEPALRALLKDPECGIDGFLCPGNVAAILGEEGFSFLPDEYGRPSVISGFEAEDILASVYRLLCQIRDGRSQLENTYSRVVSKGGNPLAIEMIGRCFETREDLWRGLGSIPESGLDIRSEYAQYDAQKRFNLEITSSGTASACRCGEVIRGKLRPMQCPLFGKACTPEEPVGPCMVSGEGACAAAYRYEDY